ncbi:MAG: UbiA family prenyltransferase [Nanoarchaeota archaeon]|nr:UbiA family prenyltransferase [Nanoarchaeota archaeon]
MNWVKFLRVKHWYYFLGFTFLGIVFSGGELFSLKTLLTMTLSTALLAFGFAVNGAYDNNKKVKESFIPIILFSPLLLFVNPNQLIVYVITMVLLFLYSYPKSNFQAVPILGTLLNPIVFSNLFLLGWFSNSILTEQGVLMFALLFFLELISQFLHEGMDYNTDKKIKKRTTIVFFGKKWVKPLCIICFVISIIMAHPLGTIFFWTTTSISLLFAVMLNSVKDYKKLRNLYKNIAVIVGLVWFFNKILLA